APPALALEFEERSGHALGWRPLVAGEEIVDVEDGAFLEQRLDELEDRHGRLVEIAIDRGQRDLVLVFEEAPAQGAGEAVAVEPLHRVDTVDVDPVLAHESVELLFRRRQRPSAPDLD